MKHLPTEKIWTGDGYGGNNPVILTQVKRTDKVALYSRRRQESAKIEGYEVFFIKMRHKGDTLPGGDVEPEDREVYPSCGSFGKIAFALGPNSERAEKRFEDLVNESLKEQDSVQVNPDQTEGAFTVQEFADVRELSYSKAYLTLSELQKTGKVVKIGEKPKTGGKGKPASLYRYVE